MADLVSSGNRRGFDCQVPSFVSSLCWPKAHPNRFLIPLILITILLIFPALFILILVLAGITMIEQARSASK